MKSQRKENGHSIMDLVRSCDACIEEAQYGSSQKHHVCLKGNSKTHIPSDSEVWASPNWEEP